MTDRTKFRRWLENAKARYVAEHDVQACECVACGATVEAHERVIRRTIRDELDNPRKVLGASEYCEPCRVQRSPMKDSEYSRYRQWGTMDYTAWAEGVLYPHVAYMTMTWEQRQHCYWLARTRWAAEGLYLVMMSASRNPPDVIAELERKRLRSLRLSLARRGCPVQFSPYTDWLDADDYPHTDRRTDGPATGGRDDADADRDGTGAEAEGCAAA